MPESDQDFKKSRIATGGHCSRTTEILYAEANVVENTLSLESLIASLIPVCDVRALG